MIEMTGVQFLVEIGIILSAITYRPVVDFSQPPNLYVPDAPPWNSAGHRGDYMLYVIDKALV
jgi:hypothetical protein